MVVKSLPRFKITNLSSTLIIFVMEQLSGWKETNFSEFLIHPTTQFITIKWLKIIGLFWSSFKDSIMEFLQSNWGSCSSWTFALNTALNQSLLSDKGMPGEGISEKVSLILSSKSSFSFKGIAVSCALKRGLEIASKSEGRSGRISSFNNSDCCFPFSLRPGSGSWSQAALASPCRIK